MNLLSKKERLLFTREEESAIDSAAVASEEFWELPCWNFIWNHNHSMVDTY